MQQDAKELVKKCDKCQRFGPVSDRPAVDLTPILEPMPFARWGMDILGPFPTAVGKKKFLMVGIDYFTKWIEAKALASITTFEAKKFVWEHLVTRFGVPKKIVIDNGTQFNNDKFIDYCKGLGTNILFASVTYPQTNGQVEAANKQILTGLNRMVDDCKGKWLEELPGVLWAIRTTVKRATGESPFQLVYGSQAVLPVEVGAKSLRFTSFQPEANEEELNIALDLLPELRGNALLRAERQKQLMSKAFNKTVKPRSLEEGDLVLRRMDSTGRIPPGGKLAPKWDGPLQVVEKIGKGTFKLSTLDGKILPRTWNLLNLKKYYI